MPLSTLDLTGMEIDSVRRTFSVLKGKYGEGYQDAALVGGAAGLHIWTLTAGVLPDAAGYGNLISSLPRFQYYWNFFQARMAEGNGPFIFPWRSKNYHASFVETYIDAEMFTIDLFASGVTIEQRRVVGTTYDSDGAISA